MRRLPPMYVEARGARSSANERRRTNGADSVSLVLVAMAVLGTACGASISGPDVDDTDGSMPDTGTGDISSPDTSIEGMVRKPSCNVASTICVGNDVYACVAQNPGDWQQTCPDACSFGRCTTAACFDAEQSDPVRGCRFYPVQVDNVDSDDDRMMMLILTNASSVPTTANLEVRSAAGDWEPAGTVFVPALGTASMIAGSARIEGNRPVRDPGLTPQSFRLEVDQPVSVVEIVSDDVDHHSTSSGGTVLRPVHAMDVSYLAVAFQQAPSTTSELSMGSRAGAGMIVVVGTVDQTVVNVSSASPLLVAPGVTVMPGPQPYTAVLNEGDVLQIFSAKPGADLSGAAVVADHPIEVFSGNVFTGYGMEKPGLNGADLAFEQLPPIKSWGDTYVGAWLAPQAGCDPYFTKGGGSWQIIAAMDDTPVTLLPSPTTLINGDPTAQTVYRLMHGQSKKFVALPDMSMVAPGADPPPTDFVVKSSKNHPILLAQWLDCEPGLSFGVDTRFGGGARVIERQTVVAFPPVFDHQLVIVRAKGFPVWFDDYLIGDEQFQSISDKDEYEVARFSQDALGPCIDLADGCSHVLRGKAFGVTWRGMDVVCGYSVTIPSSDACALPGISCEG